MATKICKFCVCQYVIASARAAQTELACVFCVACCRTAETTAKPRVTREKPSRHSIWARTVSSSSPSSVVPHILTRRQPKPSSFHMCLECAAVSEVWAALGRRRVAELSGAQLANEAAPSRAQPEASPGVRVSLHVTSCCFFTCPAHAVG